MPPLRLIHTADLHLGITFRDIPEGSSEKAKTRIQDYLRQLDRMREYAIDNGCDFFLIAGDLFNVFKPSSWVFDEFAKFIRSLTKENVKVVAVAGNHDQPRTEDAQTYTKALTDIGAPDFYFTAQPCSTTLQGTRSRKQVRFICLPYLPAQTVDEPTYTNLVVSTLRRLLQQKAEPYDYTIILAHLYVEGSTYGAEHRLITFGDYPLPRLPFEEADMACLGHMHTHQFLSEKVVYSGSIERVDYGEEGEEKGFVAIEETSTPHLRATFKPLPCRPLITLPKENPLDLTKERNMAESIRHLIEDSEGLEDAVVRLDLRLSPRQTIPLKAIEELLAAKKAFHWFPKVERIREGTAAPKSLQTGFKLEEYVKEYVKKTVEPRAGDTVTNIAVEEAVRIVQEVEGEGES